MKTVSLALLTVVFLGGCDSSTTRTQYLAIKADDILCRYGIISYNIQGPAIVAKAILYRKDYTGLDSLHPGYLKFKTEETPPDLVRLSNSIVYDTDNWEGDFRHLHIIMLNGKFVEHKSGIILVSFWQWHALMDPHVYSSGSECVEGTKHFNKHLVAAYKKDHWRPEEGYEWVLNDKNEFKRDADGYPIVKKIGEN